MTCSRFHSGHVYCFVVLWGVEVGVPHMLRSIDKVLYNLVTPKSELFEARSCNSPCAEITDADHT